MASTTIRISSETRETLRRLSAQTGRRLQDLVDEAVERYRRDVFLKEANAAFLCLRSDAMAWVEEERERRAWELTLADGLEE